MTLNYRRSGQGPALVLVHGYLLGGAFWAPLIAHLEPHFDIIAPDLPGYAGSGHLPAVETVAELGASVVGLLDELGIDRFSLIGHSMGGYVVQQIALDVGPRITKLVVYGSTSGATARPPQFDHQQRDPAERQVILDRDGVDGLRRWMAPYWFAAGEASPFIGECYESGVGGSVAAARNGLKMMPSWDITDRLNEISMPTLVIGGDRDLGFPVESMARVARDVADGRLCILPGAAHGTHYEQPTAFNTVVAEFLTS